MVFLLVACTNQGSPDDSVVVWESDGGAYEVQLALADGGLVAGAAELAVTVEGATALTFDAVMPAMGHGLTEDPVVTGEQGAWTVACVFPMSGTWTLSFGLDGEAGADAASVDVEVN